MSLAMSDIQFFQLLKDKMGDKEAEALVTFVDAKVKENVKENSEQNLKILATKEDIAVTNDKIAATNEKIAQSKTDMIKWMVGFWLAQMAAIIGLYLKK